MAEDPVIRIKDNYQQVIERIGRAAMRVQRNPLGIRLVVVTKLQPVELIAAAYQAGARFFGENYAEEALPKIKALSHLSGIEWHMIGHIQSRKARLVYENFSLVHSLDSLKLAERFEVLLAPLAQTLPALLEFNLSGEESKSGWPAWNEGEWKEILPEVSKVLELPHVRVEGLMTMPPLFEDPEQARPYFQKIRRLQDYLSACFPAARWGELSMGTSVDFEVAIEEGATLVRIGQAILGPRPSRV